MGRAPAFDTERIILFDVETMNEVENWMILVFMWEAFHCTDKGQARPRRNQSWSYVRVRRNANGVAYKRPMKCAKDLSHRCHLRITMADSCSNDNLALECFFGTSTVLGATSECSFPVDG